MDEHHLQVGRTARYYTLGRAGPSVRHVWFACHGYGQVASRFVRRFEAVASEARLVVAPEGLSRFYLDETGVPASQRKVGASWMTREDRLAEIGDYVRYLDAVYAEIFRRVERAAVRVTALGYSQGAATVSRWASTGAARVDDVVLWGGELPPDLDLVAARDRLRDVRFTVVYGERDEFITRKVADGIAARLREQGIAHVVRPFEGGHELDDGVLRELAGT
jgi:predicted esterase